MTADSYALIAEGKYRRLKLHHETIALIAYGRFTSI
jgi:hypothetical protein